GALSLSIALGAATVTSAQTTQKPAVAPAPAPKGKALIDLNKATAAELEEALPGVGAVTAKKIVDGRPYHSIDDLPKGGVPERTIEAIRPLVTVAPATTKTKAAAKEKEAAPAGKVNLNTASAGELETLPGVGPALAKSIVEGRPYKTVDELEKVKGLGKT